MALTPIKVLLFLAGGSAAAGATAYIAGVFDPYLNSPPAAEVVLPKVAALSPVEAPAQKLIAPVVAPSATTPSTEAAAPQPVVNVPSFDLVRVQGDGSIVVSGQAAAKAKVEAVIGSRVIGSAVAGPEGDFAIVVEEPLKPGDYQIVLRSTAPDNVVATSVETAVVSVPEAPGGQVLALVEQPGKPAELITVPHPAGGKAIPSAPTAEPVKPVVEAPAAKPAAEEDKYATVNQRVPATPAAAATDPVGEPKVAVEAVEIEGRKIFVAGKADAGRLVRAYANEILLGETMASPDGRFLVEAERDLPVGDYIIRVDALAPDSVKVLARAAVPFEREAGENVAAVAPQPATPATPTEQPAATPAPSPQPEKSASAAVEQAEKPVVAADQPAQVLAPKLQSADGAVIIRRGDSLWRISRRVYGHGLRYSTIYLANQDQIRDPDLILPGQVFSVPKKTDKGEEADMTRLGEQAVPPVVQQ